MKLSDKTRKIVTIFGLFCLVLFNFYLYQDEFKVLIDPNDNVFQYALIDEARNIWKQVFAGKLSPMYLLDSWQERWAEGFPLSSYYAHLPQAVLALFGGFKLFVIVRTLMLIGLPLMFFFASRILGLGLFHCFIVSLLSQVIFTDGLYGIDVSSFLWRGWGLSAQLMAIFFLPVAFAYTIDYFENKKNLGRAIFFNFLVASCHFGIFSLALLGYPLYWVISVIPDLTRLAEALAKRVGDPGTFLDSHFRGNDIIKRLKLIQDYRNKSLFTRLFIFLSLALFSLSYFIVPFFLQDQYRNYSVWDPIWKFDSWGIKQIIIWLLNGDMFDFGRLPVITYAVLFGLFAGLVRGNRLIRYFCLLFIFYFLLFLGRATFGSIIDLIPGFSEFHQHRIIVMVQFAGIFIGGWFIYKSAFVILNLFQDLDSRFRGNDRKMLNRAQYDKLIIFVPIIIGLLLFFYLEKPLINYAEDNGAWIERANQAYLKDLPDYEKIKNKLATLPKARVYAGRPGNWGKQFTVGETPLYMALSRDGYATIGFLPESWSPNSDPEQFFNDNDINFYNLYNVSYSILPENIKPPEFAKLIAKEDKYLLYEIKTTGWFQAGVSNIAVKSKKTNLLNSTRLWFESNFFKNNDYPMIDLNSSSPDGKKWYLQMTDKNNWINLNDGKERNLWQANPFGTNLERSSQDGTNFLVKKQEILVNSYKAQIEVKEECINCVIVLKQSFHPNWQVKVSGEKLKIFPVFPFYIGIPVGKAGSYEIEAVYKPGILKIVLILVEVLVFGYLLLRYLTKRLSAK